MRRLLHGVFAVGGNAMLSRRDTISPLTTRTQPRAENIVKQLETDSTLIEEVVAQMNPEQRRRLVVAGGACEWFGHETMHSEMTAADVDRDSQISPKDFEHWFESALRRKQVGDAGASDDDEGQRFSVPVPFRALVLIAINTGLPFVGFGFLDNFTMIVAGDALDSTVGLYLHLSVMASAAMGNVVSGIMGMQVHGGVEKLIRLLKLPRAHLTEGQRHSHSVFLAGHLGGTLGVAIGLLVGMLPLFFHRHPESDHPIKTT